MLTFEQFASEIKSELSKYDNVGLIDDTLIMKQVYRGMNKFGVFPMEIYEDTLEVKNNKVKLPENFKALDLAIKCEPYKVATEDRTVLLEDRMWSVLDRSSASWDECSPCDITYTKDCIVEKVYLKTKTPAATFYYNKPMLLKLTEGTSVGECTDTCKNKFVTSSPFEINIRNKTIYTNFKDGTIFVRYYGYHVDEEGMPYIPTSELGSMEEYLENKVKLAILEQILENGDDVPGDRAAQLLQRRDQKDRDLYLKAMTEYKMGNIFTNLEEYGRHIKRTFELYNYA